MDYTGFDPLVIPMVKFFNENGLKTALSCQGHNKTNLSMFWIAFDECVDEEDIQRFMRNHLGPWGWFLSCGRFAKRMIAGYKPANGQWSVMYSWCYFAATPDAANEDLRRWNSKEELWDGFDGERYQAYINELKELGKI